MSKPANAGSCAFCGMVIVIAWVQLEYRINALALVEGMNLFCVLSDTLKNRVSGLALLISQEAALGPKYWL